MENKKEISEGNWISREDWIALREFRRSREHKLANIWKWHLKIGDKVKSIHSDKWETIESIIYNNKADHVTFDGYQDRVTINGYHWNVEDIERAETC